MFNLLPSIKNNLLFFALILSGVTWIATANNALAETKQPSEYEQLNLFSDALYLIQKNYVEEVDMGILVQGAMQGLLTELDPHSEYLTAEMFAELEIETKGQFSGLGIEITVKDHLITIIAPIADTPAYRAGIQAGDKIIKIDGQLIKDLSTTDAIKMMRGDAGSQINLEIMRDDRTTPLKFTLTRELIEIDSVKHSYQGAGLGYVRIAQFQEKTDKEMRHALLELNRNSGGSLSGLVIDLRNNPGGLLDQAIKVADFFLDSGDIVSTRGRNEQENATYKATIIEQDQQANYPIVILVNGGSASAAEIVAGALQDQKRALIMGTQSFGKGSVQSLIELSDKSALRLTTARYFTPNGSSIQALGIIPDIIVEQAVWNDKQKTQIREQDLDNHFETPDNTDSTVIEENEPLFGDETDYQLLRALDLLRGWQQFKELTVATPQKG